MSTAQSEPVAPLVEHFFRHEAGRLVAVLTRIFGWRNFDLVEDMVYLLNRAIVVAQIDGPYAGIRALNEAGQDPALRHHHLFDATLGEFYRRAGELARARQHLEAAQQKTNSPFDREIIDRRLSQCFSLTKSLLVTRLRLVTRCHAGSACRAK